MQKYADDPKPIPERNRFARQDRIFDEDTGLSGDEIKKNISLYVCF